MSGRIFRLRSSRNWIAILVAFLFSTIGTNAGADAHETFEPLVSVAIEDVTATSAPPDIEPRCRPAFKSGRTKQLIDFPAPGSRYNWDGLMKTPALYPDPKGAGSRMRMGHF